MTKYTSSKLDLEKNSNNNKDNMNRSKYLNWSQLRWMEAKILTDIETLRDEKFIWLNYETNVTFF